MQYVRSKIVDRLGEEVAMQIETAGNPWELYEIVKLSGDKIGADAILDFLYIKANGKGEVMPLKEANPSAGDVCLFSGLSGNQEVVYLIEPAYNKPGAFRVVINGLEWKAIHLANLMEDGDYSVLVFKHAYKTLSPLRESDIPPFENRHQTIRPFPTNDE